MRRLRHLQLSAAPAAGRCACALVVAVLAGCAAPRDARKPVSVPVVVGCVSAVPARPVDTFGAGAYLGLSNRSGGDHLVCVAFGPVMEDDEAMPGKEVSSPTSLA